MDPLLSEKGKNQVSMIIILVYKRSRIMLKDKTICNIGITL
jgi:hypothetical protein